MSRHLALLVLALGLVGSLAAGARVIPLESSASGANCWERGLRGRIYCTTSDGLLAIDPETLATEVVLEGASSAPVVNARTGHVYARRSIGGELEWVVLDERTGVVETLDLPGEVRPPVPADGVGALDARRNRWFGAAFQTAALYVVDGASRDFDVVALPPAFAFLNAPRLSIDPATGRVYVISGGDLAAVDPDALELAAQVSVAGSGSTDVVTDVAVDGGLGLVYAALGGAGELVVYDPDLVELDRIPIPDGSPAQLLVDPGTHRLYVRAGHEVHVVDGAAGVVEASIPIGGDGGSVSLLRGIDTRRNAIYASRGSTLTRIDGVTLATRTFELRHPVALIAVDTPTGRLFASHGFSIGEIAVVDPRNLLPDPDFDLEHSGNASFQGWVDLAWSNSVFERDTDREDRPPSGSLRHENFAFPANTPVGVQTPCFRIEGGTEYEVGAWIRLTTELQHPLAEETPTRSTAGFFAYASTNCSGDTLVTPSTGGTPVTERGVWRRFSKTSRPVEEARSARMVLTVGKVEAGGLVVAHYDSLFVPEPRTGLGAGAALVALLLARRILRPPP